MRGSRIDGQFEVGHGSEQVGFVVLAFYGDMFSAVETACFVDRAGAIRDRLSLGHATEQGLITEIAVDGPATITVAFPTNQRHRLRVQCRTWLFGLVERWLILQSLPEWVGWANLADVRPQQK